MNTETLKEAIKRELPDFFRTDPDFRDYILELTRREYAGLAETHDRFYEILGELRRDREAQTRKWEEQKRESKAYQEEQARKWEEQRLESKSYREEQARKWEFNQAELLRIHEEIMAQ
ncbi:MAG: hypothetical protein WCP34_10760, partial [Pseudomonadota bacterium]